MNKGIQPTYEEQEALLRKETMWTWKRFFVANGLVLLLPGLILMMLLSRQKNLQPRHSPYDKVAGSYDVRVSTDGLAVPAEEEMKVILKKQQMAEERRTAIDATRHSDAPVPEPTIGLFAIGILGLGLLAFGHHEEHLGWGVCAAALIVFGLVLGTGALVMGSFHAFDSFLSLRPAEFLNLPVSRSALILFATVTPILGIRHFPDLVYRIGLQVQEILRGLGRGVSLGCKGYVDACWLVARKLVPVR